MRGIAAAVRLALLDLQARRRRILALLAFAAIFLAAAAAAHTLAAGTGRVDLGTLYQLGGYPLLSGLLVLGWLLGRFPLAATLVLMSGVFSGDRETGLARLLGTRPVSPGLLYGTRFLVLSALAFAISAVLMPLFDIIILGQWAGPATLVLIAAHVLVWGGLTALLSVATRLDAWLTLLLALFSMVWASLGSAGLLPLAPPVARAVAFVLPPQAQLFALEGAFVDVQGIPWPAFWFAAGYGGVTLLLAAVLVRHREI